MKKKRQLTTQGNRLTLKESNVKKSKRGMVYSLYSCKCGNEKVILDASVKNGNTKSCGCLTRELARERLINNPIRNTAQGQSKHPLYRTYYNMLSRCFDSKNISYASYGGRGIKVARRWLGPTGFKKFLADVGQKPSPRHSLDRIDNDGDYGPDNTRWASPREQLSNTRKNIFLTYQGFTLTCAQWARVVGVSRQNIEQRLKMYQDPEDIIFSKHRPPFNRNKIKNILDKKDIF